MSQTLAGTHESHLKKSDTIEELAEKLKRVEAERDEIRSAYAVLSHAHMKLLTDSSRLQVKLGRAAQDSLDSYHAKVAELSDVRTRHFAEKEQQRAEMNDARRISEDRLESTIIEKLEIISQQIDEIREMKERLNKVGC